MFFFASVPLTKKGVLGSSDEEGGWRHKGLGYRMEKYLKNKYAKFIGYSVCRHADGEIAGLEGRGGRRETL